MASINECLVLALALVLTALTTIHAGDPDITSDFIVPPNTTLDSSSFTFTGLKNNLWVYGPLNATFKVTKASQVEFPLLTGQSVSFASLQFGAGSVNPPHTHPRSAELLLLMEGCLEVGFVDSTNKLFNQTIQAGDIFLFPKGLVHFQLNPNPKKPAFAISAFGSANAGTVSVPKTVFGSGISLAVLEKSFKVNAATVEKLVSGISA